MITIFDVSHCFSMFSNTIWFSVVKNQIKMSKNERNEMETSVLEKKINRWKTMFKSLKTWTKWKVHFPFVCSFRFSLCFIHWLLTLWWADSINKPSSLMCQINFWYFSFSRVRFFVFAKSISPAIWKYRARANTRTLFYQSGSDFPMIFKDRTHHFKILCITQRVWPPLRTTLNVITVEVSLLLMSEPNLCI